MNLPLLQYVQDHRSAILTKVPIHLLDHIKALIDKPIKIRYRGPRNTPLDRGRSYHTRASSCLKANATHFSVYLR
jgi:hypothetical protein